MTSNSLNPSNPEVKADKNTMVFDTIRSFILIAILFVIFQLINILLMDRIYDRNIGTIFIVAITIGAMVKTYLIYESAKKDILAKIKKVN